MEETDREIFIRALSNIDIIIKKEKVNFLVTIILSNVKVNFFWINKIRIKSCSNNLNHFK